MVFETRKEILNYLDHVYSSTSEEMSRALGLTKPDIHYHLNLLTGEGVLEREKVINPETMRGRPRFIYRKKQIKTNSLLSQLVNILLKERLNSSNVECLEKELKEIAELIFPVSNSDKILSLSLQKVMLLLCDLDFKPSWEAHKDGPKIIFHQCPYLDLSLSLPELCKLDQAILQRLSNHQVIPLQLRTSLSPFSVCIFALQHLPYSI